MRQIVKSNRAFYLLLAVIITLVVFPFFLNWILLKRAFVPVVGNETTWLSFWPMYLSAIASFGMIYITYLSLRQSKEQIEEMKKRDDEEQRARIVISVIVYQTAFYLRIFNIGKENAYNVRLIINDEFIDEIEESFRIYYKKLAQPDYIEAGKSIYIFIGWCEDVNKAWEGKDIVLKVKGDYNDKYSIEETLDMRYFIGKTHFMVKGDLETTLEHIKKGIIVQNNAYKPVQKSLDDISNTMSRIDYSIMCLSQQIEKQAASHISEEPIEDSEGSHLPEENNAEGIPIMRD